MVRRLAVIAAIFATTLLLLFLSNKVLVGTQELQATVQPVAGRDLAFEVVFKDLAGNRVDTTPHEQDEVRKRLHGSAERRAIATTAVEDASGDRGMVIAVPDASAASDLRDRLQGRPFKRPNPPRALLHLTRGIDIRGGVEFVCRLYDDDGQRKAADDETIAILRNRLDERGLTEPQVTRLSNGDVQVVIPGGTDADAARTRKVLETTGRLEFREVLPVGIAGEDGRDTGEIHVDATSADSPVRRRPNGGYEWARENLPRFNNGAGLVINRGDVVMPQRTDPGQPHRVFYRLSGHPALVGKDVADAGRTIHNGQLAVSIRFTAAGAGKNEEFTRSVKEHGDRRAGTGRLAICFDGVVQSAPVVIEPSRDQCVISGRFSEEEIDSLRTVLKGGSLSVTPVVLSQRTVGASLGEQSVSRSISTMAMTFVLIVAFMVLYYRRLGWVATACLGVCGFLIWAVLSIFGATVTLPGLAGLVLTIGMAVDTNILVFERIREELRENKGLKAAIDAGYERAFWTIVDAHITTLTAAMILYWVGSGPVKGFGLTLAIGIVVNLFTGLYVGRLLTDWLCRSERALSMGEWFKASHWHLPYVGWRWYGYVLSVLTAVLSLGWFAFGHRLTGDSFERNFDIDFTGGNMAQVIFTEPMTLDQVQSVVAKAYAEMPQEVPLLQLKEVRLQPYYAEIGQRGASQEWVFRSRDEQGSRLEGERSALERERVSLQRQWQAIRDRAPEGTRPPELRELEQKRDALIARIEEKQAQIANRAEEFKAQIAKAFAGRVGSEGDEIVGAAWEGPTLTMTLATLATLPGEASAGLADRILGSNRLTGLTRVSIAPRQDGPGFTLTATWREAPLPRAEVEGDDPLSRRIEALLAREGLDPALRNGQVVRALALYNVAVTVAASAKVTVAKPFPSTEHFSGQVAGQMKMRALVAMLLAMAAILAYVAMRFEFRFGLGAVVALLHDVLITVGLVSVLGIRIDLTVIAALLTIIGYSINDTIVVFDRIRENLRRLRKPLAEIINLSVAQTMPRTILTTGTVIVSVLLLWMFGGESLNSFTTTLLIGLVAGTYSSVFVAAPLLLSLGARVAEDPAAETAPSASGPVAAT